MKSTSRSGRHGALARHRGLRIHPIAAAVSGLLFTMSAVRAQEQPASPPAASGTPETVIVTGIRGSIEGSIAVKKNADSIVEAVTAEDIGKLPDVSIAESLSRLPGLAGQRVDGREQVIAIRGMSPDFAGTLLNGREQTTTGLNRGVEYDQYPSELLSGATVYKTPDATLLGQGLSGTVDLHTVRPLDLEGRKAAFNVRAEHNSLGALNGGAGGTSANGGRFSAAYIDQFADRTLGLALGYAHLDAPGQEQHYKAWWWGAPGAAWYNGAEALGGAEVEATSRHEVRDGLMSVLEYKPNKNFHSTLDAYYSQFNQTEVMRGVMWDSNPWCTAPQNYTCGAPLYTIANPGFAPVGDATILNSGTITFPATGHQPVVRNDYNRRDDKLTSLGWNNEATLGSWKAIADLSYSSARRNETVFETYAGTPTSSIQFNIPVTPAFPTFTPSVNFADPTSVALSDPGGWGHVGRRQNAVQNDVMKALNLHGKHDLTAGIFNDVDLGVDYSVRDKTRNFAVDFAQLKNGGSTQLIDPSQAASPVSLAFAGIPGVLSYDVNAIASQYYNMVPNMSGGPGGDLSKNYGVHEKITTGYVKAGIDTEIAHIPVHGNLGVQLVHTDQSSNSQRFDPSTGAALGAYSAGASYNDVLPSLNLVGDIGHDRVLRLGLAKTLARPRIDDMNAAISAGVDPTTHLWGGGGGNPALQPWRAKSFDLSLEQYWGKRSYVAGALFYKSLDTYIYSQTIPFDYTGFINPNPAVVPLSNAGTYTTQANGHGGNMRGLELSAAIDGRLLARSLDGFGATASLALTNSSIQVNGPGSATAAWDTLPGLSKRVAGLTLYYEKNGFSARINDRYRSDFRGEYVSLFGSTSVLRTLAQNTVDFQTSYEFQQGQVKGLSVMFQVVNLTNAADRNIQDGSGFGSAAAPQEFNRFGRQYLVGLSYKL